MNIQNKVFPEGELVIYVDYTRSEHAGAASCFQIVDIIIEGEEEKSILKEICVDQGKHYLDIKEVMSDLGLDAEKIDYREECI